MSPHRFDAIYERGLLPFFERQMRDQLLCDPLGF